MIIPNWRAVLRKAWSLRFMTLAAILSGVEIVLPLFSDKFPRGIFATLSFFSTVGAVYARFIVQKEVTDHGDTKR